MSIDRRDVLIAGSAALFGAGGMAFALTSGIFGSRQNMASAVREAILANPEMLPEAMDALRAREAKKFVNANRKQIETPFGTAWAGAADGDVVLVQFFDYACGYCRAVLPDIDRLLGEDPKLKIVYRELPILSDESDMAARASLAVAQKGGNYAAFHRALYAAGRPDAQSIAAATAQSGVSIEGSDADRIASEIATNLDFQRQLQLTGTPAWIVGDTVLNGAVGYEALKKAIDETRAARS